MANAPIASSRVSAYPRAALARPTRRPAISRPIRRPWKRIRSAKATEPPHLGQTLLLRGIAAVVADALPSIGRAPASAGPRGLAPLRARPAALGVSVGEQQSHYCDTEQNKTDRAHAVLPVQLIPSPNSLRTRPSQPRASRHCRAWACGPHDSRKLEATQFPFLAHAGHVVAHALRMVRSVPPSLVGRGRS